MTNDDNCFPGKNNHLFARNNKRNQKSNTLFRSRHRPPPPDDLFLAQLNEGEHWIYEKMREEKITEKDYRKRSAAI